MIINLNFKVKFATTGKTISGDHDFKEGMTAITGQNESGKSLRLEMIRYALFGTKALRSETKNYKSLDAKLTFKVGTETYTVHRTTAKVTLLKGTTSVAIGTKSVNDAITRILGYDIEVFDVTNACLQGEIEALTQKTPSERKRMVDRTIGLDAVDRVLEGVVDDISATKKAIETLNDKVLQVYEKPIQPQETIGLVEADVQKEIDALHKKLERRFYLTGLIDNARTEWPQRPSAADPCSESLEDLQTKLTELQISKAALDGARSTLAGYDRAKKKLDGLDIPLIKKFLADGYAKKWTDYTRYLDAKVEQPHYTQADIDRVREGLAAEEFNKNRDTQNEVECPSCQHKFHAKGGALTAEVQYDKDAYNEAWERIAKNHPAGAATDAKLRKAELLLDRYDRFVEMTVVDEPDLGGDYNQPGLVPFIEAMEEFTTNGYDAEVERTRISSFDADFDSNSQKLANLISEKKKFILANNEWAEKVKAYETFVKLQDQHSVELKMLEGIDTKLDALKALWIKIKSYNEDLSRYTAKMEAQEDALNTRADLESNLLTLANVRKALIELKPKVKTYLLPSLNNVASTLISEMTNGQRTTISIDDNFDIMVDGQPVSTLSGSGKAVANLAVRIGLGTVLTNTIFSVFLADEIDAAMDDNRAAYTAECLQNLTNTIHQIILVSHQKPDADHQIEL